MLIKQLLNDSEVITKRPDARARALLSINTVLADVCNNADYPNDLVETVIANPTPGSYTASIPIVLPDLPARRKIEYVIAAGKKLTAIKPRAALSTSGCVWKDAYYRSGNEYEAQYRLLRKQFRGMIVDTEDL